MSEPRRKADHEPDPNQGPGATVHTIGWYFDRDGNEISLDEYTALHEDPDYRKVARDQVGDLEVITNWIGTDQGPFVRQTRPYVFGTIVRDTVTGEYDDRSELFSATQDAARATHARVLAELNARTDEL